MFLHRKLTQDTSITLSSGIWGTKTGIYWPTIIVVGEDIDFTNTKEVICAMTTRIHPVRDIHIKKRAPGHSLFPLLSVEEKTNHTGAAVFSDATFPFAWKGRKPQLIDFEHAWSKETHQLALPR